MPSESGMPEDPTPDLALIMRRRAAETLYGRELLTHHSGDASKQTRATKAHVSEGSVGG